MTLKVGFIDRHRLCADTLVVSLERNNPVDHQEGITVWKDFHNILHIHYACPLRYNLRGNHRYHVRVPLGQGLRQFSICRVSGFDRDNVTQEPASGQKEVTDDIEDLVANEFVRISQRFLSHNRFAAHNDRVLEASPSDQAFVDKRFQILIENERTSPSDFFLVNTRCDFGRIILGKATLRADLCARDSKLVIRHNRKERARLRLDVKRLAYFQGSAQSALLFDTAFVYQLYVRISASVTDRRFVRIHLNQCIVYSHAVERRKHMLDGVHLDVAFRDGRRS